MRFRPLRPVGAGLAVVSIAVAIAGISDFGGPSSLTDPAFPPFPADTADAAARPAAPERADAQPGWRGVANRTLSASRTALPTPDPGEMVRSTWNHVSGEPQQPAGVISASLVSLPSPLHDLAEQALAPSGDRRIRFPLTDGRFCDLDVVRHEVDDQGNGVVIADVAGQPISHAVLAYVGDAVAGTIQAGSDGLYQVRYAGHGVLRISQLDPDALPDDLPAPRPPDARAAEASARTFGWVPPVATDVALDSAGAPKTSRHQANRRLSGTSRL